MNVKIFLLSLSLGLLSCNGYKQASLSNERFLSHRIFKQNYQKYVYLVHDADSSYLLRNVTAQYKDYSDSVSIISGILKPVPEHIDSLITYDSIIYLVDHNPNKIEIFLTEDPERTFSVDQSVDIEELDIQKVRMDRRHRNSYAKTVAKVFIALLVGFLVILGIAGLFDWLYWL